MLIAWAPQPPLLPPSPPLLIVAVVGVAATLLVCQTISSQAGDGDNLHSHKLDESISNEAATAAARMAAGSSLQAALVAAPIAPQQFVLSLDRLCSRLVAGRLAFVRFCDRVFY